MKKTLIALAAAATLAVGLSATAKADPAFGFGFGVGPFGHPHIGFAVADGYGPGYYPAEYGDGYGWRHPRCHVEWRPGWYGPHRVLVCHR